MCRCSLLKCQCDRLQDLGGGVGGATGGGGSGGSGWTGSAGAVGAVDADVRGTEVTVAVVAG